jgi:hypothetical protein
MLLATTWLKHPAHGATAVVPGEDPEAPSAGRHSAFKAWGLEIDRASFAFPFVPNATVTREPLEASLSKLSCDLARPLLRAKASVHAADSLGWQPLHYAAGFGDRLLTALLVEAGADLTARTSEGFRPIDLAQRHGHVDVAEVLLAVGSPSPKATRADVDADTNTTAEETRATDHANDPAACVTDTHNTVADLAQRFGHRVIRGLRLDSDSSVAGLARPDCDLRTVAMDTITEEAFREQFLDAQQPVLLTNSSEVRMWPATERWALDTLERQHGDGVFQTSSIPYAGQYGLPHKQQTLKDFLNANSGPGAPDVLFESKIQQARPALLADFDALRLFRSYRVHPHQFLVGTAGSGAPWHFHQDAFNVLVHGTKRWFLRPPSEATMSTEHPLEAVGRSGSDGVSLGLACTQRAGDVMYVPDSYSHLVLNLKTSVALAVEFYPSLPRAARVK